MKKVKKTTAKKPAVKKPVAKKPAAKKPAAKKSPVQKTPAKKPVAKKPEVTPEQRYRMIEEAAYFIAERHGFSGDSAYFWSLAEAEVSTRLS